MRASSARGLVAALLAEPGNPGISSVKSFIAAIDAESVDQQKCISTIKGGRGRRQGTYAAELVVMRYAG